MAPRRFLLIVVMICSVITLPGCRTVTSRIDATSLPAVDYTRPLPPGWSALRRITDPARMPDIDAAWHARDALLLQSMDRSLSWFAAPSSRSAFPFEFVSHAQAEASVWAMRDLLERTRSAAAFRHEFDLLFNTYESVGYDGSGIVLFTGYYAPEYPARRTWSAAFPVPLYQVPADLERDPDTHRPIGRRAASGRIVPYYTRREIEHGNLLAGTELAWLPDRLSAFLIHVNGSAKLRMPDGELMYIGYSGTNELEYASLGKMMIREGLIEASAVSISRIREVYRQHPAQVEALMLRNNRYVFFTESDSVRWPTGSLGVQITRDASLATDKTVYPRGGVILVDTESVSFSGGSRPYLRFMLDQDTGGAIKAPGRADIFFGTGETVGVIAGEQKAEGRLYYIFLKPNQVATWRQKMNRKNL